MSRSSVGAMLALLVGLTFAVPAWSAEPLRLEGKIALGDVAGRIDHLGYDPAHQRLFVAELGNNSVGIIDLKAGRVAGRLSGLHQPQGLAWHPGSETLYVANAGDGSVRLYQSYGDSDVLQPAATIALGDDADDVRLDTRRDRIVVGYGKGSLAVIDPASRRKTADIPLLAHPESFQFDEQSQRIFANVPNARQVAVVDLGQGKQISGFDLGGARSNFPMAVDAEAHRMLVVTRSPARLIALATDTGKLLANVETCGDSDDLFVDPRRRQVYVSCGEGMVEVFGQRPDGYQSIGRVQTASGARTALFVTDRDRLYVAVRAGGGEPAAIWIFRPVP